MSRNVRYKRRRRYGRGGLGKGGSRSRLFYGPRGRRAFVPRTMGAFAVSESKYFDSFLSASVISEVTTGWTGAELNPATLNCLFAPQAGTAIFNRVGNKVEVYKIAIRGVITMAALAGVAVPVGMPPVRLIIYQDKQTNAAQVQAEVLMANPGANTLPLVFSTFQSLSNLGRFRVLKDVWVRSRLSERVQDAAGTAGIVEDERPFKCTIKFKKPVVVRFNATDGGSVADIIDNSFHMCGVKAGAGGAHSISYQVRTYYKDQ